ncbi:hypothetical protein tloyanaT_16060 [Thalassotalea loyana]|uniref:Nuclear transport factor 2 family protein n=1 Tax=Thalassotalea loyana TaxID=280483 RepID=A0ABQ6HD36_9GAMM|nr:nuclear transport factor 2 family protein [Thalassotalea loyana]GLX85354.1 hypothetical protein tloyanaT_16060 [Thalassotalea loyana]
MLRILLLFVIVTSFTLNAEPVDKNVQAIERAILDYIESQHQSNPEIMKRGLDKKLAKRTYWQSKDGQEFVLETDHDTMVWVAENYNKNGDKFPKSPTVNIDILDIDQRVASVKLTVDDWIDYMHLYQTDKGEWKIINVLWQFHDTRKHVSN